MKSSCSMRSTASSKVSTIADGSLPLHIAGRARTLTRSLIHRRSRVISCALSAACACISGRRGGCAPHCPTLAEFFEELFGRNIERILLKSAADDDHRMRSHDVDHRVAAKLPKMVHPDDWVVVPAPN